MLLCAGLRYRYVRYISYMIKVQCDMICSLRRSTHSLKNVLCMLKTFIIQERMSNTLCIRCDIGSEKPIKHPYGKQMNNICATYT